MTDEQRTAFVYPRPDGGHWFPTIVETLEKERDRALRQRDEAQSTIAALRTERDDWEALVYRIRAGECT